MKCQILHESKGRMRVRLLQYRMTLKQADILEYYLKKQDGVLDVKVNDRTSDAIILFDTDRDKIVSILSYFHYEENEDIVPEHTGRELSREYEDKVIYHTLKRAITRICLPLPVRSAISFIFCSIIIVPFRQDVVRIPHNNHRFSVSWDLFHFPFPADKKEYPLISGQESDQDPEKPVCGHQEDPLPVSLKAPYNQQCK